MQIIAKVLPLRSGEEPQNGYLYKSGKFTATGRMEFLVLGTVSIEGVDVRDQTVSIYTPHPLEIEIGPRSGIVFNKLPTRGIEWVDEEEVPDVPEMSDSADELMYQALRRIMIQRGILPAEAGEPAQAGVLYGEEVWQDDDDEDFEYLPDEESLYPEDQMEDEPQPGGADAGDGASVSPSTSGEETPVDSGEGVVHE